MLEEIQPLPSAAWLEDKLIQMCHQQHNLVEARGYIYIQINENKCLLVTQRREISDLSLKELRDFTYSCLYNYTSEMG